MAYRKTGPVWGGPQTGGSVVRMSVFLPARVRVGVNHLGQGLRDAAGLLRGDLRARVQQRHSEEELLAMSRAFAASRGPAVRPEPHQLVVVAAGDGLRAVVPLIEGTARAGHPVDVLALFRSPAHVAAAATLQALPSTHGETCAVTWLFENDHEAWPGGQPGGVTVRQLRSLGARLRRRVAARPELEGYTRYVLAGPAALRQRVRAMLERGGVAADAIEDVATGAGGDASPPVGATWTVRFARSGVEVTVSDDRTILAAGQQAGVPLAFSCTMGGCAACRVRVLDGALHMDEPNCLTSEEARQGYCLACVAQPRAHVTIDA